jgi:hypothetical protein
MLQPITTSGIKIRTTLDTSTTSITAAMSPIPATMATTPKTFSPVRRTDLGYPKNDAVTRETPAVCLPQHPHEHRSERPILLAVDQELGQGVALWVPQNSPIVGRITVIRRPPVAELGPFEERRR